jgi:glutathione S-transferase
MDVLGTVQPRTVLAVARFHVRYLGKAVAELETRILERGAAALARMEQALQDMPFLVGAKLSLADVALVAYTRVAHEGGFSLDGYPAVKAWVGRVEQALRIA